MFEHIKAWMERVFCHRTCYFLLFAVYIAAMMGADKSVVGGIAAAVYFLLFIMG